MIQGDMDYYTICPHCLRDGTYQLRFQNPKSKKGSFIKGTSISYRLTREKLEEAKRIRRELERFGRNYDRIVQRAVRNAWVKLRRGE